MFGKNQIVGQSYFKDAGDKLFVTSIFYTLQGEGPYRGMPAVFVRLAKCNLDCSFCDTFFDDGDWLTPSEIVDRMEQAVFDYFDKSVDLSTLEGQQLLDDARWNAGVVLTGGEPMLQANIGQLIKAIEDNGRSFGTFTQIESNGTLLQQIPQFTTLVISPKCSEKTNRYLTISDKVLQRADCLKFVMSADPTSPYCSIPDWALEWKNQTHKQIFVSPMNMYNDVPLRSKVIRATTNQIDLKTRSTVDEVVSFWEPGLLDMKANQANHEYAAKYCIKYGCTFNMQLHLFASLA